MQSLRIDVKLNVGVPYKAKDQTPQPTTLGRSQGFALPASGSASVDMRSYHWYDCGIMSAAKVAISMDGRLLRRLDSLVEREVFRSRSEAIQKAVTEKLARLDRSRLARECAKLLPAREQEMAEEGIARDGAEWPEY